MEISSVKEIFLKYILMPLIAAILLLILNIVRRNTSGIQCKGMFIYFMVSSICLAIPSFLGFSGNLFAPYWYLTAQMMYLILGTVHVMLLGKYFRAYIDTLSMSIVFESLLSLACIVFGGYLFIWVFNWMSHGTGYPVMSATSSIIFLVPLAFDYCYRQLINIPVNVYKTWSYSPDRKLPDFKITEADHLTILNIEVSKKAEDPGRFRIKGEAVSAGYGFGDWFYRIVDDYNQKNPESVIDLVDEENQSYSWIFYIKKPIFNFRKYIDFDLDIKGNNISENDIVICKRVIQDEEEGVAGE